MNHYGFYIIVKLLNIYCWVSIGQIEAVTPKSTREDCFLSSVIYEVIIIGKAAPRSGLLYKRF